MSKSKRLGDWTEEEQRVFAKKSYWTSAGFREAFERMIDEGGYHAFKCFLQGSTINFHDNADDIQKYADKTMERLFVLKSIPYWECYVEAYGRASFLRKEDTLGFAVKKGWLEAIDCCLRSAPRDDKKFFSKAVMVGAVSAPEILEYIVAYKDKFDQEPLNKALAHIAGTDAVRNIEILLAAGASPDWNLGEAIVNAAQAGAKENFTLLLSKSTQILSLGEQAIKVMEINKVDAMFISEFKRAMHVQEGLAAIKEFPGMDAENKTVIVFQKIGDLKLTTIFNFTLAQQILVTQHDVPGGALSTNVVNFHRLPPEALSFARKKYTEKYGEDTETKNTFTLGR